MFSIPSLPPFASSSIPSTTEISSYSPPTHSSHVLPYSSPLPPPSSPLPTSFVPSMYSEILMALLGQSGSIIQLEFPPSPSPSPSPSPPSSTPIGFVLSPLLLPHLSLSEIHILMDILSIGFHYRQVKIFSSPNYIDEKAKSSYAFPYSSTTSILPSSPTLPSSPSLYLQSLRLGFSSLLRFYDSRIISIDRLITSYRQRGMDYPLSSLPSTIGEWRIILSYCQMVIQEINESNAHGAKIINIIVSRLQSCGSPLICHSLQMVCSPLLSCLHNQIIEYCVFGMVSNDKYREFFIGKRGGIGAGGGGGKGRRRTKGNYGEEDDDMDYDHYDDSEYQYGRGRKLENASNLSSSFQSTSSSPPDEGDIDPSLLSSFSSYKLLPHLLPNHFVSFAMAQKIYFIGKAVAIMQSAAFNRNNNNDNHYNYNGKGNRYQIGNTSYGREKSWEGDEEEEDDADENKYSNNVDDDSQDFTDHSNSPLGMNFLTADHRIFSSYLSFFSPLLHQQAAIIKEMENLNPLENLSESSTTSSRPPTDFHYPESPSSLSSLPTTLSQCLSDAIDNLHTHVEKQLYEFCMKNSSFLSHLHTLRSFLLVGNGEFFSAFLEEWRESQKGNGNGNQRGKSSTLSSVKSMGYRSEKDINNGPFYSSIMKISKYSAASSSSASPSHLHLHRLKFKLDSHYTHYREWNEENISQNSWDNGIVLDGSCAYRRGNKERMRKEKSRSNALIRHDDSSTQHPSVATLGVGGNILFTPTAHLSLLNSNRIDIVNSEGGYGSLHLPFRKSIEWGFTSTFTFAIKKVPLPLSMRSKMMFKQENPHHRESKEDNGMKISSPSRYPPREGFSFVIHNDIFPPSLSHSASPSLPMTGGITNCIIVELTTGGKKDLEDNPHDDNNRTIHPEEETITVWYVPPGSLSTSSAYNSCFIPFSSLPKTKFVTQKLYEKSGRFRWFHSQSEEDGEDEYEDDEEEKGEEEKYGDGIRRSSVTITPLHRRQSSPSSSSPSSSPPSLHTFRIESGSSSLFIVIDESTPFEISFHCPFLPSKLLTTEGGRAWIGMMQTTPSLHEIDEYSHFTSADPSPSSPPSHASLHVVSIFSMEFREFQSDSKSLEDALRELGREKDNEQNEDKNISMNERGSGHKLPSSSSSSLSLTLPSLSFFRSLRLEYRIPPLLQLIFTRELMDFYSILFKFSFLIKFFHIQIEWTATEMNRKWRKIMKVYQGNMGLPLEMKKIFSSLQLILSFVSSLENFFQLDIFDCEFRSLIENFSHCHQFDHINKFHRLFITNCEEKSMVREKEGYETVIEIIQMGLVMNEYVEKYLENINISEEKEKEIKNNQRNGGKDGNVNANLDSGLSVFSPLISFGNSSTYTNLMWAIERRIGHLYILLASPTPSPSFVSFSSPTFAALSPSARYSALLTRMDFNGYWGMAVERLEKDNDDNDGGGGGGVIKGEKGKANPSDERERQRLITMQKERERQRIEKEEQRSTIQQAKFPTTNPNKNKNETVNEQEEKGNVNTKIHLNTIVNGNGRDKEKEKVKMFQPVVPIVKRAEPKGILKNKVNPTATSSSYAPPQHQSHPHHSHTQTDDESAFHDFPSTIELQDDAHDAINHLHSEHIPAPSSFGSSFSLSPSTLSSSSSNIMTTSPSSVRDALQAAKQKRQQQNGYGDYDNANIPSQPSFDHYPQEYSQQYHHSSRPQSQQYSLPHPYPYPSAHSHPSHQQQLEYQIQNQNLYQYQYPPAPSSQPHQQQYSSHPNRPPPSSYHPSSYGGFQSSSSSSSSRLHFSPLKSSNTHHTDSHTFYDQQQHPSLSNMHSDYAFNTNGNSLNPSGNFSVPSSSSSSSISSHSFHHSSFGMNQNPNQGIGMDFAPSSSSSSSSNGFFSMGKIPNLPLSSSTPSSYDPMTPSTASSASFHWNHEHNHNDNRNPDGVDRDDDDEDDDFLSSPLALSPMTSSHVTAPPPSYVGFQYPQNQQLSPSTGVQSSMLSSMRYQEALANNMAEGGKVGKNKGKSSGNQQSKKELRFY